MATPRQRARKAARRRAAGRPRSPMPGMRTNPLMNRPIYTGLGNPSRMTTDVRGAIRNISSQSRALRVTPPPRSSRVAATWGRDVARMVRAHPGKVALGAGIGMGALAMSRRTGRGVDRTTSRPTGMYAY